MSVKPSAQPNQSLIDGIRVLQALAIAPEPIGCRSLARELDLTVTKVNRLLRTLAHLGIVRQTIKRKYTAGSGMHVLAAQSLFAGRFTAQTISTLERLRRFGHTVAMGVLWNDSVSYLYHAPPGIDSTRALARIGVLPASNSGIGIALLAQLDDSRIREIYANRDALPGHPNGLETLLPQLEAVRKNGYARVLVNAEDAKHTIAIPVGEPVHAGVGISGWLPESGTDEIVTALREAAKEIDD